MLLTFIIDTLATHSSKYIANMLRQVYIHLQIILMSLIQLINYQIINEH